MTNANRKAAIRQRMADTGENYTTAKRAIEQARGHARERVSTHNDLALERAVYVAYDQGTVVGFLAQELFETGLWRESKAVEHPDDNRNLPAAKHLVDLARQILALPDNDPRILRMESALQMIADANGALPETSEITRTIGFSWGYPSLDVLLDRYAEEYTRELEQLKRYVASTSREGIMPAAQRISEALNIRLDEVLAAMQKLGPWAPAVTLAGEGTLTAGTPWFPAATLAGQGTLTISAPAAVATATAPRPTVLATDADVVAAIESLGVVRQVDAAKPSRRFHQKRGSTSWMARI